MNAYGINFLNRSKKDDRAPECNYAEFTAFAALCASLDVAHYVESVMWDGNICAFVIDVDIRHEQNDIGGAIGYAADATLSQYVLFCCNYCKRSLEDEE